MAGGVTLFQFLPSSRVTWIKPSSVPDPDRGCLKRRGADGIDDAEAVGHRLVDILGGDGIESRGNGRIQPREIGTDFLPGACRDRASGRRIDWSSRALHRPARRPAAASRSCGWDRWDRAAGSSPPSEAAMLQRLIAAPGAAAVENVAVLRIGNDGVAFAGEAGRLPVAEREHALARPGADADAAAILLRAVEPVGEAIVGGHVINLRGRLVVPGAPGLAAIDADHRALIAADSTMRLPSLGLTHIW